MSRTGKEKIASLCSILAGLAERVEIEHFVISLQVKKPDGKCGTVHGNDQEITDERVDYLLGDALEKFARYGPCRTIGQPTNLESGEAI